MVGKEDVITVEFLTRTVLGTAGVYSRGEVATFPKSLAEQLLTVNERTGKVSAQRYPSPKQMTGPPVDKQVKTPPKKKQGARKRGVA